MRENYELLLPVGHKDMALAAIHNGADAIFVGFPGFNARGRSYDHEIQELQEIIKICHHYGVKVNLAFNILIFQNEIVKVTEALKNIIPLKPDALIIQDIGLAQIVRQMCPQQVIHGSTQMTVTNDLAIQFLDDLNIKRFVLGRENSLAEIKLIQQNINKELEVFVHGALCVSYSGQCFTSETLGGRSANRGQCAQSCRLNYDLIVDGEKKNLVDRNYLVSPQDLCGIKEIPELMNLGVASFKVEGRLKSVEYVASVAKSYREVINHHLAGKNIAENAINHLKNNMAVEYSRGFFPGWLHGVNHQQLVDGTFSAHRGAHLGYVQAISKNSVLIKIESHLKIENGDGLLFVYKSKNSSHKKEDIEKGSYIFSIHNQGQNLTEVSLANDFMIANDLVGSKVYVNHAKSQKKEIAKSYQDKNLFKKIPISYSLELKLNHPLVLNISDGKNSAAFSSDVALSTAINKGLTKETLEEELNSLSGTIYRLDELKINCDSLNQLFIPNREIKHLRQKATAWLDQVRQENTVDGWKTELFDFSYDSKFDQKTTIPNKVKLVILLRNKNQVEALLQALLEDVFSQDSIDSVILDFEFGRDYAESINQLKLNKIKVGLATTRILKPNEYQNLKNLKNLDPDFILARNLGAIEYFKKVNIFEKEIRIDFSLNITNHISANYFLNKNINFICLSYDLNAEQISDLLNKTEASKCEITIHQSMPSFHMEHCVFAAFLSQGKSFKDCGKPCEKHNVQLKDQFGNSHWIKPDHECRNTMFNAKAQTALGYLEKWQDLGIGLVRYEALSENKNELVEKIKCYLDVIDGQLSVQQALVQLKTVESYGLSSGNLEKTDTYQARKKQPY